MPMLLLLHLKDKEVWGGILQNAVRGFELALFTKV